MTNKRTAVQKGKNTSCVPKETFLFVPWEIEVSLTKQSNPAGAHCRGWTNSIFLQNQLLHVLQTDWHHCPWLGPHPPLGGFPYPCGSVFLVRNISGNCKVGDGGISSLPWSALTPAPCLGVHAAAQAAPTTRRPSSTAPASPGTSGGAPWWPCWTSSPSSTSTRRFTAPRWGKTDLFF